MTQSPDAPAPRTTPLTAKRLVEALLAQGVLTDATLVSLLGEKRLRQDVNTIELALLRRNLISEERLLQIVSSLTGRPAYEPGETMRPTAHLPHDLVKGHGALLLNNPTPTIAMVEDSPENVAAMHAALHPHAFQVVMITATQFGEMRRAAYESAAVDERVNAATIYDVLDALLAERASDLHLAVGDPPKARVDGGMADLKFKPLDQGWMRTQVEAICEERHLADLERKFSTDLAYSYGTHRFRVNIGNDRRGLTMAWRKLPSKIPSPTEIGLPQSIVDFADLERGMVLVVGPTGSGKSTTLAAVLHRIIMESKRHVITLEDPIEFQFPTDGASHVNQRELGSSFFSFADGIRDAMRQDPDVILVGEMRDATTIGAALTAAETGHLCIGTLHTYDAPSTIARIVNSFPTGEQPAVRAQLSQLLKGVVAQTLLPRQTGSGRVAAFEVMVTNTAIETNLRKEDGANQLRQTMETARGEGMMTMEYSLASLATRGLVSVENARFKAKDKKEFERHMAHLAKAGSGRA